MRNEQVESYKELYKQKKQEYKEKMKRYKELIEDAKDNVMYYRALYKRAKREN